MCLVKVGGVWAWSNQWRVECHHFSLCVEAQQMGMAPLCLQAGTRGSLVHAGQSSEVVCWQVDCSALSVFSFLTCSLLSTLGVGVGKWVWQ